MYLYYQSYQSPQVLWVGQSWQVQKDREVREHRVGSVGQTVAINNYLSGDLDFLSHLLHTVRSDGAAICTGSGRTEN